MRLQNFLRPLLRRARLPPSSTVCYAGSSVSIGEGHQRVEQKGYNTTMYNTVCAVLVFLRTPLSVPWSLIKGEKVGRSTLEEVTVFKSVGTAVVDALAAQLVYETCTRS